MATVASDPDARTRPIPTSVALVLRSIIDQSPLMLTGDSLHRQTSAHWMALLVVVDHRPVVAVEALADVASFILLPMGFELADGAVDHQPGEQEDDQGEKDLLRV